MKTEGELDPRIKVRAPLRCDGVGRLECAEDVESGERLAIRWLPLAANGVAAAKALESIPSHPTLPRIRETGLVGQSAYVAMHFPDGRLVSALTAPLSPLVVARMGASVAAALAAVHAQGVVHGELSADSVLLLDDGKYILWDLPLVLANRLTDRRREERAVAQLLKSAPYLGPERARGGEPSPEADVYALGVMLCVAAGMPLPTGLSTMALIHQVATGQWRAAPPAQLPAPLVDALRLLLDTSPLGRPLAAEAAEFLGRSASALEAQTEGSGPVLVGREELEPSRAPDDLLAKLALDRRPRRRDTDEEQTVIEPPGRRVTLEAPIPAQLLAATLRTGERLSALVSAGQKADVITEPITDPGNRSEGQTAEAHVFPVSKPTPVDAPRHGRGIDAPPSSSRNAPPIDGAIRPPRPIDAPPSAKHARVSEASGPWSLPPSAKQAAPVRSAAVPRPSSPALAPPRSWPGQQPAAARPSSPGVASPRAPESGEQLPFQPAMVMPTSPEVPRRSTLDELKAAGLSLGAKRWAMIAGAGALALLLLVGLVVALLPAGDSPRVERAPAPEKKAAPAAAVTPPPQPAAAAAEPGADSEPLEPLVRGQEPEVRGLEEPPTVMPRPPAAAKGVKPRGKKLADEEGAEETPPIPEGLGTPAVAAPEPAPTPAPLPANELKRPRF